MRARLLALSASVLALAACGGGGGGTAGGSGTLTKAGYDAKLSHLCLLASDQYRELHLENSVASWKHYAPQITRIEQSFDAKLAALKPPSSIAADVAAYTRANGKASRETLAAVAAAKAGDAAKLHLEIKESNKASLATWPSAKAIGATGCYIG